MKKLISLVLFNGFLLSACGASEAEIQTAIAETDAAKPTSTYTQISSKTPTQTFTPEPTFTPSNTPTVTITPTEVIYNVELQVKSPIYANVFFIGRDLIFIEYGANRNISTNVYDYNDLWENNFPEEPGYRLHWSKEYRAVKGAYFYLAISGPVVADCIIVVDGEVVVKANHEAGSEGQAVCQYTIR